MPFCHECNTKAGKHHIIFKGSKSIIVYLPINEINLCKKCHKKIHSNKAMDDRYKCLLQTRLEKLLPERHYSLEEIKRLLKLKYNQAKLLAKHVQSVDIGYSSDDVIKYLLCGKLYC